MNYFKQGWKRKEEEKKDVQEPSEEEEDKNQDPEDQKQEDRPEALQKEAKSIPPLITAPIKKRPVMTRKLWMEMARIRRWDLVISNISVTNLYEDPFDPFLEVVVGGDFRIIPKKTKEGSEQNVFAGSLGYTQKSEVLLDLEHKETRKFATRVKHEYRGSYFNIQEEYLRIDIWDWEKWGLNRFMGRKEIPLLDLAQGDVYQELEFFKFGEKKKTKLCKLTFNVTFQEIFDFCLNFRDWGVNGIMGEGQTVSPSVEVFLPSQGVFKTKVTSEVIEDERNPQWPTLKGSIYFRGTINDLEHQQLCIVLYNGGKLMKKKIGTKNVELTGVTTFGSVNAEVVEKYKRKGAHACSVKGKIFIPKLPKYSQCGELIQLRSDEQYLYLKILRVDNVVLPNDKGIVNTFVGINWGGYNKRTKTAFKTYKPIFDDTFYFPITVSSGLTTSERIKSIQQELHQNPCVSLNFWAIDEQLSNDSLGSCNIFVNELQSAKVREFEFFDEKTNKNQMFKIRVASEKKRLQSPFLEDQVNSNVYYELGVLFEDEKKLYYEDLPKDKKDKLPPDYQELKEHWVLKAREMRESFPDESQRFFSIEQRDEYDRQHFLPLFLCKMTYPLPPEGKQPQEHAAIDYLKVETFPQLAYYVSLIPFSGTENDIWSSPDFLVQMGKGEVEDHSILMANLFMGATKEFEETTSKDSLERRVFVCVGTLKHRKTLHVWLMTIDQDCKGVKFWESTTARSFSLPGRVSNPENLNKFLNKQKVEQETIKFLESEEQFPLTEEINTKREDFQEILEQSSQSSNSSSNSEDLFEKPENGDVRIEEHDLDQFHQRFKHKVVGTKPGTTEPTAKPKSYIELKREAEKKDPSNFKSIIQEPISFKEISEVKLPYRTIDIIFNNRNVFMNLQHFDPARILYDIQDTSRWYSFKQDNHTAFTPFYSPPNFRPALKPAQALKLQNKILKEVKSGINALRSGKNLATSWKNNKDYLVELMEEQLLFLERSARQDFDSTTVETTKRNWSLQIKQFMPTNYRFSGLPGHFNYPEPDRITTVFLEEGGDFFEANQKNMKWALAIKVFPYIANVVSIRIMAGVVYEVPLV